MDDDEFKFREKYRQRIRLDDRDDADERFSEKLKEKRAEKEIEYEKKSQLDKERQKLRDSISRKQFNERNSVRRAEKREDKLIKSESDIYKSDIQRVNHADSLEHSERLSEQEHHQKLKQDAQWRQHEINLKQGELRAEQLFIQERQKGDLALAEADHQRAEMLAEYDYQQAISVQQEITTRDIATAREQTERELAIAKENNNQALVLEKLQHLSLLEQKERDLFDYEARVKADTQALRIKEDEALDRRLKESRHTFGQDLQKLHAEFLRMKLDNELKKDYFTHEQETLLRMRKIARDLGLDPADLSASDISEMIMDFENLDRGSE